MENLLNSLRWKEDWSRAVHCLLCCLSRILEGNSAPVRAHCDRLLSDEYVLLYCSKFQNQQRKYHLDGKSIDAILDDDVDVGNLVGYLQDIKDFNII